MALWLPQLLRCLVLIALGLFITFLPNHDSVLGMLVLGAIGIATGIAVIWESLAAGPGAGRGLGFLQAATSVLIGAFALLFSGSGVSSLLLATIVFAGTTGILELLRGVLSRGRHSAARDWLTVGVLTSILALIVVFIPADFARNWSVVDHGTTVSGVLDAQIVVVGLIGAWAILSGVFLFIAALSNKWAGENKGIGQVEKEGASVA